MLVKIHAGPKCISVSGEHALIGATGVFVRDVQLLAGTPVVVQFCGEQDELFLPGIVYAHYADIGLSVEFNGIKAEVETLQIKKSCSKTNKGHR